MWTGFVFHDSFNCNDVYQTELLLDAFIKYAVAQYIKAELAMSWNPKALFCPPRHLPQRTRF
jgi:hypothetical protein